MRGRFIVISLLDDECIDKKTVSQKANSSILNTAGLLICVITLTTIF